MDNIMNTNKTKLLITVCPKCLDLLSLVTEYYDQIQTDIQSIPNIHGLLHLIKNFICQGINR